MMIIGLTGGIGMGKSTTAAIFRRAGFAVFDADRAVHALQAPGGAALAGIAAVFPGTVRGTPATLDRAALRAAVLADPGALRQLEAIVHPLVRADERRFLATARRARRRGVVLDIPLLLESHGELRVDRVVVVSAPRPIQIARVLRRGQMSLAQIVAVIARQMPDREKRRRADFVIPTGLSRNEAWRAVQRLIETLPA